jgi:hypothetical protein
MVHKLDCREAIHRIGIITLNFGGNPVSLEVMRSQLSEPDAQPIQIESLKFRIIFEMKPRLAKQYA